MGRFSFVTSEGEIRYIDSLFNLIKVPDYPIILLFGGLLQNDSDRKKVLEYLLQKEKYLLVIPDKIKFFDISSSNYNLNQKEEHLFNNSDMLIIIPESPGSFAEIGMISAITKTKDVAKKVMILTDAKYKYDESFLKFGPIKLLTSKESTHYNTYFNSLHKFKIESKIDKVLESNPLKRKKEMPFFRNSIFLLLYLYYKKEISILFDEFDKHFNEISKITKKSITRDNLEFLESAELVKKDIYNGKVQITINYQHFYVSSLLDKNVHLLTNVIHSFLTKSGY